MFFARFVGLSFLWFVFWAIGSGNNGLAAVCAVLIIPLTIYLYLMPTLEASKLKHPDVTAIAMVNVFLGWTLIGWVVALSWAFKKPPAPAPAPVVAQPVQPLATPASAAHMPPIVEAPATKTCPFCAETILSAAVKCKHCGSTLTSEPATT